MVRSGSHESQTRWFIESRATMHLCNDRSLSATLEAPRQHNVEVRDGAHILVYGKGTINATTVSFVRLRALT